jgi:hypothetical protein
VLSFVLVMFNLGMFQALVNDRWFYIKTVATNLIPRITHFIDV